MKPSELDLAILRTDEVLPRFQPEHGDYPGMFEALISRAAAAHEPPVRVEFSEYDARRPETLPEPGAHRAYLITGSRNSVYDDEPWIGELADFLREALAEGSRIVGICFGHQLIAHFFGGRTAPAAGGWGVGVQENRIVSREPWMDGESGNRLNLIASHKDQVVEMPEGAKLIATSDFCPVGGFVMGDRVMTLQGHPEFQRAYSRDLMTMRREILGESVFNAGMASLDKETDEDRVGRWIVDFLLQDDLQEHGEEC
ncbi:MAG: amidotransferase [Pseudomonadales bacterium]